MGHSLGIMTRLEIRQGEGLRHRVHSSFTKDPQHPQDLSSTPFTLLIFFPLTSYFRLSQQFPKIMQHGLEVGHPLVPLNLGWRRNSSVRCMIKTKKQEDILDRVTQSLPSPDLSNMPLACCIGQNNSVSLTCSSFISNYETTLSVYYETIMSYFCLQE